MWVKVAVFEVVIVVSFLSLVYSRCWFGSSPSFYYGLVGANILRWLISAHHSGIYPSYRGDSTSSRDNVSAGYAVVGIGGSGGSCWNLFGRGVATRPGQVSPKNSATGIYRNAGPDAGDLAMVGGHQQQHSVMASSETDSGD